LILILQQFQGQHKENNNNRYYYNCPAPATGISRQLKSIFIRNKTTSNLISVLKDVSGIEYLGTGEVLLIPGQQCFMSLE
jgi:hypothetical protein